MPLLDTNGYAYYGISAASKVNLQAKTLIEVPIIDNVGERPQFEALFRAFSLDPDIYPSSYWPPYMQPGYEPNKLLGTDITVPGNKIFPGSVMWRPFEGLPAGGDPKEFLGSPVWDFGGFIDQIIWLLTTQHDLAVYVHCQLGADRTGAFHIGYLMRKYGLSLAAASAKANSSTSAGPPNADYQRLVAAYALQLGL